jgi:TIR domain
MAGRVLRTVSEMEPESRQEIAVVTESLSDAVAPGENSVIFLSYRRQDAKHFAGRLRDCLALHFGPDQIFMDVNNLKPGDRFARKIDRALITCEVLLAVIGSSWLAVTDSEGRRRIDDPRDLVRLEIERALIRELPIIPILVDDTVMPNSRYLPECIADLADYTALRIRHDTFAVDSMGLIDRIGQILASSE